MAITRAANGASAQAAGLPWCGPSRRRVLPRLLVAAGCSALLMACGGTTTGTAQPEPTEVATSASPGVDPTVEPTEQPTASEPSSADPFPDRVVASGIRLDRLESSADGTVAQVTNLNDTASRVALSIAVYKGGDVPAYVLTGAATVTDTAMVVLEEESGEVVQCADLCSYAVRVELSEPDDDEPQTNETLCTEDVCALEAETDETSPTPDS